jgi:signal transduction histidine kinase
MNEMNEKNDTNKIILNSIKNAKAILFVCDKDGKILLQEGDGLKDHNLIPNQYVGCNVFETFKFLPEFLDALVIALAGKPSLAVYKWGDDYCESRFNPTAEGNVIGICTSQTDRIFREKEVIERAIIETKKSAQEDLLAIFAHEMRNPLSSVISIINLLKSENSDQSEYYNVMYETSNEMLNMLNNLLDESKFKKGFMKIDINSFNINTPIDDVILLFKYNTKNINIIYLENEYSKIYCIGDQLKIKQVLINFINNALKFSENNTTITIKLEINNNLAKFSVKDQGIGISKENLDKLFTEYTQLSGSYGTGLGLSICKKISDLLKGEIGCESEINIGSTFWFKIPLQLSISNFEKNLVGSWVIK